MTAARPLRIADLGTGSGAILLALLSELPERGGSGTDIEADALEVARANARKLGLADRARISRLRLRRGAARPFDLVVSNPPYIASAEIATLAPEVREHDPLHALDGGADGLAAYRAIAAVAPRLLRPAGHLVVEIGAGQERDVELLFHANGLAVRAAPRSVGHPAGACRDSALGDILEPPHGPVGGQKTAWNVAKDRLGSHVTESIPNW